MDLDVAHPFLTVNLHPRMAVVRTRIPVMLPDRQDFYTPSVCRLLVKSRPQTMLPNIMQNNLRHSFLPIVQIVRDNVEQEGGSGAEVGTGQRTCVQYYVLQPFAY